MLIEILPHYKLHERKYKYAIIINSPGDNRLALSDEYLHNLFQDFIYLEFHDIDFYHTKFKSPNIYHVEKMLEFAATVGELTVSCQAGISRSSAAGYGVLCSKIDPSEAIKILSAKLHRPNNLLVHLFAEKLQNPAVWDVFDKWIVDSGLVY